MARWANHAGRLTADELASAGQDWVDRLTPLLWAGDAAAVEGWRRDFTAWSAGLGVDPVAAINASARRKLESG